MKYFLSREICWLIGVDLKLKITPSTHGRKQNLTLSFPSNIKLFCSVKNAHEKRLQQLWSSRDMARFLIDPLHYFSSSSDFGFEFAGNRKTTPWLAESGSRRISDSATIRLGKSGSRWLSDSASRGVDDSATQRVGESTTRWLGESGSRRLGYSPSQGVAMVSRGVAIQIFKNL
jgi:hypothetical protein